MGDFKESLQEFPRPNPTGVLLDKQIELYSWSPPEDLIGKVVSTLDELRKLMPPQDGFSEVFLDKNIERERQNFDRYSRQGESGMKFSVAYGCHKCKKIIISTPRIEAVNPKGKPGWQGVGFYCVKCQQEIGKGRLCSYID